MRPLESGFLLRLLEMMADLSGYIEKGGPQTSKDKVPRRGRRFRGLVNGMQFTEKLLRDTGLTASAVTAKKFPGLGVGEVGFHIR